MKAGVIGATGYAGAELVRLLSGHPKIDSLALSSVSFEGEHLSDVYPNFQGRIELLLTDAEQVTASANVIFAALPHGITERYAKECTEKGIPFIDLSADFRFGDDEETYSAWYGKTHQHPQLCQYAVYGLPELNRARIQELAAAGKIIVGNPGCYPTSASLGAYPAIAKGIAEDSAAIIVDSISGVTGGGREPARSFHFPECADSVSAYKVGAHRHSPEIARNFAGMAARHNRPAPPVIFTPHLAPMNRGILSTIYIPLAAGWLAGTGGGEPEDTAAKIRAVYSEFYRDEPFVRVLPPWVTAATNRVRQSNYCDISVHLDHSGSTLIICSAIDNMVKGAAGQAVQNMNVIFGYAETSGLEMIPALF
ncbi:MAG: N-acetyl-gamma-glutamyl-phosphate reductase [Treponema sp.]|nr:N-acetyl-gamma-glutamyl-phosphate reductase [Treponema sp.]